MSGNNNETIVGADSIAVESIIIALLSPIVFGFATSWKYYLVFQLALGLVVAIMLFRVMANEAEDPNMNIINNSLRWSSKLLLLALIGALATISIRISTYADFLIPVAIFTAIAFTLSLSFALLDQLLLGEYAETWAGIIFEETGDTVIGAALRDVADFGKEMIEAVVNNEPTSTPHSNLKTVLLGIGLLTLLLIVSLPIWLILAEFFGDWGTAVLVFLAVIFLRDVTRYIYLNYGAARSFAELKWRLRWEFMWTIVMGVLLSGVLGYDLTAML